MNTSLPENVHAALVAQYNVERYNSAVYRSLASAFEEVNWSGFAKWCSKSADEELEHSKKFFNYLAKRQAAIEVANIPAPNQFNGEDLLGCFESALALEVETTAKIASLTRLALDMNDFMTLEELQWFNNEQADSEAEIVQILSDLSHAGSGVGYTLIDQELGSK
jgi:ferritin